MAFRRSGNMHYVGAGIPEHHSEVAEPSLDGKTVIELPGHEGFPVTNSDDLAFRDPLNLRNVRIGNFSTAYDRDLKHTVVLRGNFRNSGLNPPPRARSVPIRVATWSSG